MSNIPSNLAAALGRPPVSIPQCRFLIRKGEQPRADRSNIFMWTPALALRINEFDQYLGELPDLPTRGQSLSTVVSEAPVAAPPSAPPPVVPEAPKPATIDDAPEPDPDVDMRVVALRMAFAELTPEEMKTNGTPNTNAVRSRTGFGELTAAEVQAEWLKYQEASKEE